MAQAVNRLMRLRLTARDLRFLCIYLRPNEFYNNQLFSRSQIIGMSFIEINLFP
jgi:hypothetical protein